MHKKACKQFTEDKQTWNHVLWSDETKIDLFGSDGVKHLNQCCLARYQITKLLCYSVSTQLTFA
ncbi:hypothetical protein NFI96_027321, partial [Prochilodus magdalenae]